MALAFARSQTHDPAAGPAGVTLRLEDAPKYRSDIDGLRAIAIAGVIGYHALPSLMPGGFVGVDVFFGISGFLITGILLRDIAAGNFSVVAFYARRIRRLFPALITVLAAVFLAGWFLFFATEFRALGEHICAAAAYLSNYLLSAEAGYFDTAAALKPLLHLWSLAVEEQFYIVWPFALILASKRRLTLIGAAAVTGTSLLLSFYESQHDAVAAFYLPQYRLWELSLGALLAVAMSSATPRAARRLVDLQTLPHHAGARAALSIGGAILIGTAFLLARDARYPAGWVLIPTLGTLMTIAAGGTAPVNRRLLSRPAFVYLGRISYPLYLWHWPLLSLPAIIGQPEGTGFRMAAVGIAFILAAATYHWIERPLRARREPAVTLSLLAITVALGLLGAASYAGWIGPRLDDRRFAALNSAAADWAFPGDMKFEGIVDGAWFYAKGDTQQKILFFGDSNMQQYWPRIGRLLAESPQPSWSVIFATAGGCPPIPMVHTSRKVSCNGFAEAITARARAPDIRKIVIGADWASYFSSPAYYYDDPQRHLPMSDRATWDRVFAALGAMIQELRALDKPVFVILNIPTGPALDPLHMLRRSLTGGVSVVAPGLDRPAFEAYWAPVRQRLRTIAAAAGAVVIDPMAVLCNATTCPAVTADGQPLYKDSDHLRASYVRDHIFYLDDIMSAPPAPAASHAPGPPAGAVQ